MNPQTPPTPRPANNVDKPVDESLCTHCGKCCYKKIIVGRTVFITPFPCEFLDTSTNLCTVYEKRHEVNPLCLSVPAGMKVSAFPSDCPYVETHAPAGYRPARDDNDWAAEWHDLDNLAADLDVSAPMLETVRARGPYAAPMYDEAFAKWQNQTLIWGKTGVVDLSRTASTETAPSIAKMARDTSQR